MGERVWTQFGSTAKYSYNYNAFKVIDTEEKAYWLGFMYADGYVSANIDKFSLSIADKDKEHLSLFRDFIVPDRPLESQKSQGANRITVSSKEITEDLVSKGCTPRKSLTLQPPAEGVIPNNLICHFVRGYFDGDGCARLVKKGTRVKIDLTGTEKMLEYCIEQFRGSGAICRSKIRKATNYNAYVWSNEAIGDIKKIYDYLYSHATVFLKRKEAIMRKVYEED